MKRFQHNNGFISYYKNIIAERMQDKKEGRIVKWKDPDTKNSREPAADPKFDTAKERAAREKAEKDAKGRK